MVPILPPNAGNSTTYVWAPPGPGTRLKALAAGAVPPGSWRWVVDTLGSAPWVAALGPVRCKGGGVAGEGGS